MFYASKQDKPYFYKAQRIKKGTTAKGDHYTFVSISHKDKQDGDKWKNATIYIWDDVDVKEGDSIAFFNVTGVNYRETENGFKKYIDLVISTSKVKVKEATEKSAEKSNNTASQSRTTTPEPTQSAPVNEPQYVEVNDGDLPF